MFTFTAVKIANVILKPSVVTDSKQGKTQSGCSELQGDSIEASLLKTLKKDLKNIIGPHFCYF